MSSPNTIRYKPSPSVREVETSDGSVLLDLRHGLCLSLDPISLKVWRLLPLNYSLDQIAEKLASEFGDVTREQIRSDIADFASKLDQKGLLCPGGRQPDASPRCASLLSFPHLFDVFRSVSARIARRTTPRWLIFKALLGLMVFYLLRLRKNVPRVYEVVTGWPRSLKAVPPSNGPQLVCNAVNYACVIYPRRVLCVQRSCITTCLARSCGIAAQMVIGAQKVPYKSHAWTEVHGHAINERRDVQSIYMVWDRC
jgi:hypothetical protein